MRQFGLTCHTVSEVSGISCSTWRTDQFVLYKRKEGLLTDANRTSAFRAALTLLEHFWNTFSLRLACGWSCGEIGASHTTHEDVFAGTRLLHWTQRIIWKNTHTFILYAPLLFTYRRKKHQSLWCSLACLCEQKQKWLVSWTNVQLSKILPDPPQ